MRKTRTALLWRAVAVILACPGIAVAQPLVTYNPSAGELPVGVAADKAGHVWVSLGNICQVRRYDRDWQETLRITVLNDCTGGAATGGLAVDATGLLYVQVKGPAGVGGVYTVDESGVLGRIAGTEQLVWPNSIAFDHNNGTMYVTDMVGGSVWRVPPGGEAELWANHPLLSGVPGWPGGPPLGANGIAVDHGVVLVSVTLPARLLRLAINQDGTAGIPEVLYSTRALASKSVFALDDIALDVFGNIYASVVAAPTVARLSADGSSITTLGPVAASVTSLAFGTGNGERQSVFVATNGSFFGTGAAIVKIDVGVPGRPIP